jgi:hypothetical protein
VPGATRFDTDEKPQELEVTITIKPKKTALDEKEPVLNKVLNKKKVIVMNPEDYE